MSSNYWIKVYQEVLDDPKMGRLPDNLWRRFFECCLMAGELQQDGRIPSIPDIAWRLRIEEETLRGEFESLARMGLLDFVSSPLDEHWIVVKFAERQAPMSGAERVKRYRETQKKQHYYGTRNENVTYRYTDGDKDKDEDEDGASTNFGNLFDAFVAATGIPETMLTKASHVETIKEWSKNEFTVEEVYQAVGELQDKGLSIVRPASIDSALVIVRSKSGGKRKKREPRIQKIEHPDGTVEEVEVT